MSAQPSMSATQWRERAGALEPRSGIFIDGRFVPAASGATFDNINPATGRSLGAVAAGEQEIADNPRARSAKLRAAERTDAPAREADIDALLPRLPTLDDAMRGR